MDKLRLQIRAMDEIHPDLRDLKLTMDTLSVVPDDFEGQVPVNKWWVYLYLTCLIYNKSLVCGLWSAWKSKLNFRNFISNNNLKQHHFFYRLTTLSDMRAHDELSEEEVRQMLFDLEQSYNAFNRLLQHTWLLFLCVIVEIEQLVPPPHLKGCCFTILQWFSLKF